MRARSLFAFIVLAGCFSGLDEGKLTGSGTGSGATGDLGGVFDLAGGGSNPDGSAPWCDDFAGDPIGSLPPVWTAVSGSWKVVDAGNGMHALGQTSNRVNGRTLVWMGNTATVDLALSATVRPGGGGSTDCLAVRYHDEQNYYALCLSKGTSWELSKLSRGQTMTLDQGQLSYDVTRPHALVLAVKGDRLTGTLDGNTLTQQRDGSFTHGGVALATDGTSSFAQVCITPL